LHYLQFIRGHVQTLERAVGGANDSRLSEGSCHKPPRRSRIKAETLGGNNGDNKGYDTEQNRQGQNSGGAFQAGEKLRPNSVTDGKYEKRKKDVLNKRSNLDNHLADDECGNQRTGCRTQGKTTQLNLANKIAHGQ
jgi:hypothetical protein